VAAYTRYETVVFGTSKAGLTTVGYQLYGGTGMPVGGRVTVGIADLGGGQYGAQVDYPDGFLGRITWDTGGVSPVFASAEVNPPEASPQDTTQDAKIAGIEEDIVSLDRALASDTGGVGVTGDDVVRAGIPEIDDCKILTRLKAFIVDQGAIPTLEHVMRDRVGRPIDLTKYVHSQVSVTSTSSISTGTPTGKIRVRIRDFIGEGAQLGSDPNPIWELDVAYAFDAGKGVVRGVLEAGITEKAGIYEIYWAVCGSDNKPIHTDRGLLSVERGAFPVHDEVLRRDAGPPTLQEVRMRLMDSSSSENLLLDDIEFKDEQIMLAMAEPVRLWNESPPPLRPHFTTRTFPFRGAWISGVLAQLHLMAANRYRRNRLAHSAGGTTVDDLNKEKEYMTEGQRLWQEYRDWMFAKKVEINMKQMVGSNVSAYSTRNGW
jgi:hypothetical protein